MNGDEEEQLEIYGREIVPVLRGEPAGSLLTPDALRGRQW
jgi:hypothetical protein